MFRIPVLALAFAALLAWQLPAGAQNTMAPATGAAMQGTAPAAMAPAKAKKPRSEKQKKNDEIMRACGADWKAAKAAGTVKGQKWHDYLKECRAKKKAEMK